MEGGRRVCRIAVLNARNTLVMQQLGKCLKTVKPHHINKAIPKNQREPGNTGDSAKEG